MSPTTEAKYTLLVRQGLTTDRVRTIEGPDAKEKAQHYAEVLAADQGVTVWVLDEFDEYRIVSVADAKNGILGSRNDERPNR